MEEKEQQKKRKRRYRKEQTKGTKERVKQGRRNKQWPAIG